MAAAGTGREPQGLQGTEAVMSTVPSEIQILQSMAHILRPSFPCLSVSLTSPQPLWASAAPQLQTHQALLPQDLCICCWATSSNVHEALSFSYILSVLSHSSLFRIALFDPHIQTTFMSWPLLTTECVHLTMLPGSMHGLSPVSSVDTGTLLCSISPDPRLVPEPSTCQVFHKQLQSSWRTAGGVKQSAVSSGLSASLTGGCA